MATPLAAIYPLWEDAIGEKQVVLTRDNNPQYVYIANYEWVLFADNRKARVMASFLDEIDVECELRVRIMYSDNESVVCVRTERQFSVNEGAAFDILQPGWTAIEIGFRVKKINGKVYVGPKQKPFHSATVTVGRIRVHVNFEQLTLESEVFKKLRAISCNSEITIFDLDSDLFLELLRVINQPNKMVSGQNFSSLLILAARFRMEPLKVRLAKFTQTAEYDKRLVDKWTLKKIDRVLKEDPLATIQVLDEFRALKRTTKPLMNVAFDVPEAHVIKEKELPPELKEPTTLLKRIIGYCSGHKESVIIALLIVMFIENLVLLIWFTSIYRVNNAQ